MQKCLFQSTVYHFYVNDREVGQKRDKVGHVGSKLRLKYCLSGFLHNPVIVPQMITNIGSGVKYDLGNFGNGKLINPQAKNIITKYCKILNTQIDTYNL